MNWRTANVLGPKGTEQQIEAPISVQPSQDVSGGREYAARKPYAFLNPTRDCRGDSRLRLRAVCQRPMGSFCAARRSRVAIGAARNSGLHSPRRLGGFRVRAWLISHRADAVVCQRSPLSPRNRPPATALRASTWLRVFTPNGAAVASRLRWRRRTTVSARCPTLLATSASFARRPSLQSRRCVVRRASELRG